MFLESRGPCYRTGMSICNLNHRTDLHQFVQLSLGVACQFLVGTGLEDDTASQIHQFVKVLQERNAVGDNDATLRGEEAVGANNVV